MRCLLESHDYSSTDILLPPEMADFLIEWNELNIPDEVLFTDEDGGKGRELEPHCTVKYGLIAQEVPAQLRDIADDTGPFPVFLGEISLFTTSPDFDVVKLDVESPWLRRLNKRISDTLPNEDTHPEYRPHVTLAYVKKGTCDDMEGDDPFKEGVDREFQASELRFSGPGDGDDRVREQLSFSKIRAKEKVAESVVRRGQDQELASVAASLVESWWQQGLSSDQMLRKLRSGNWSTGMKFWANRDRFPGTFNRLVEQTAEYIGQVDPFAKCNFPADPDRVKLFLRNTGKRRGPHAIL